MAFTNSPLVEYTRISPNRNQGRYADFPTCKQPITKIDRLTIHHWAGTGTLEQFGELVANPARQMSANYAIDTNGRIGLFCPESDRSWCSSSSWNDSRAITIEVANDIVGQPWSISSKSYESLIKLCVDICKRNGIKKLEFTGDKNGSLTYHYMFAATSCPETWIKNHTQEICDKVNAQLTEAPIGYTKTLVSGTPIYAEIGKPATGKIAATTRYTIVQEKTVNYIKYGKLKSGVGWVELEKLKRTFDIDSANDIKELQTALNKNGFSCGIPDGVIGDKTQNAMFQALCEQWLQVK